MKLFLLLPLIIFSISSCKSNDKVDSYMVKVKFIDEVEGYQVSAIWNPVDSYEDYTIGPAIVQFSHKQKDKSFSITTDYFSISNEKLPFTYEYNTIIKVDNDISIPYNLDKVSYNGMGKFGTTSVPFFFMDIDLDGEKELLIPEFKMGQRGTFGFKYYTFSDGYKNTIGLHRREASLDQLTSIDPVKKELTQGGTAAWCNTTLEIYKMNPRRNSEDLNLELIKKFVISNEIDNDGKCYEYTYKVENFEYILTSKKLNHTGFVED